MAHFARIENNIVREVIVVNNDVLLTTVGNESEAKGKKFCADTFGGTWIQTSYNAKIRGKFAGIGDFYDVDKDIFVKEISES
jgi:hypothetical protein